MGELILLATIICSLIIGAAAGADISHDTATG